MLQGLIEQEIVKALDALLQDKPGGTVTRHRLQAVLERTAQKVAGYSRDDTLINLKSSQQVADLYRVSRQSINTRAARFRARRGSFGWEVGRGWWVFTPEEVERLRPGPAGRPKKKETG